MKKIILITMLASSLLAGCKNEGAEEERTGIETSSNMELVEKNKNGNKQFLIYRNIYTDVLYIQSMSGLNAGGLEEMSNPETGLPLTYKKYAELSGK